MMMKLDLLSTHSSNGLTLLQFAAEPRNSFSYITSVRVTEVSQAGSVALLRVENLTEQFVFFLDGDILVGTKQDRVRNTDVLLAPQTVTILPVSCIEPGRWRWASEQFRSADAAAPPSLRARKARHLSSTSPGLEAYQPDQADVWQSVAECCRCLRADTPTQSLADAPDQHLDSIQQTFGELRPTPDANGPACWLGDHFPVADIFNRTDALPDYFQPLLRGVWVDFVSAPHPPRRPAPPEALLRNLAAQIASAWAAAEPPQPAVGRGTVRRFLTPEHVGFALQYQGHCIHLDWTSVADCTPGSLPMHPPSAQPPWAGSDVPKPPAAGLPLPLDQTCPRVGPPAPPPHAGQRRAPDAVKGGAPKEAPPGPHPRLGFSTFSHRQTPKTHHAHRHH